ncbi:MAG: D-alanyl-D-alanine carboxypeptidase family protein [Solirubrobacterales bacterium]
MSRGFLRLTVAVLGLLVMPPASAGAQAGAQAPPALQARAWILIDARTGETLAARTAARPLSIASATKLMTAHLALQNLRLGRRVRMAPYSALPVESVLGVPAGTRISVRDLLYSLILRSGNDSAYTLAEVVAGSQPRFVAMMNRSAAALGLSETHFTNPIGLDAPGNHSSARDLAALTDRLLENKTFVRLADSSSARLRSLSRPLTIASRNTLLLRAPWVTGVKTGHTLDAGYVLVGSARRKGVELISVVLGAPSETQRDSESLDLLEYGFSQYRVRRPVRGGEIVASPSIRYAGGELPLRAAHPITVGVRRGQAVQSSIRAPEEVTGPIRRDRRLGRVTVAVDGRVAGAAALLASRSIAEASTFDKVRSQTAAVPALIAIVASAILLVVLVTRRRRRTGRPSEEEMQAIRENRRRIREQRRGGRETRR